MSQQKFCPLHAMLAPDAQGVARVVHPPCDPQNCAFGSPEGTGCLVRGLARSIIGLFLLLSNDAFPLPTKPKGAPDEPAKP